MTTTPMPPVPPSGAPPGVSTDDLHAWVDGLLAPERVAQVLAWLQTHPDDAARVAEWQAQRLALRRLARESVQDDVPAALTDVVWRARRRLQWRSTWSQALAAGVLLAGGLGAGHWWGTHEGPEALIAQTTPPTSPHEAALTTAVLPAFVRDAGIAHAVFSPEKRHPVEVTADEEAHLVQWLSRRLGAAVKVPVLASQGYRLLGGRLLPGEGAPRAQFMYEDSAGVRLTLYVTVFPSGGGPGETAFRSVHEGDRQSFYWVDDRFGYALSAPMQAPRVQAVAREVYRQLEQAGVPADSASR